MSAEGKVLILETLDEDIFSDAFNLGNKDRISIQAVIEGSPSGSLKLQVSNDILLDSSAVSNWVDYPDSATTITGATSVFYNLRDVSFKWIRLAYIFSSGTGLISASAYSTSAK